MNGELPIDDEPEIGPFVVSSEQAVLAATATEGWGPRVTLASEQKDDLIAFVKPPLVDEKERSHFRRHVDLVFAATVERYAAVGTQSGRRRLKAEIERTREQRRASISTDPSPLSHQIHDLIELALEKEIPLKVVLRGGRPLG